MLQFISVRKIEPLNIVAYDYKSKRYPSRGGYFLLRCKACGKKWKSSAAYASLCRFEN